MRARVEGAGSRLRGEDQITLSSIPQTSNDIPVGNWVDKSGFQWRDTHFRFL